MNYYEGQFSDVHGEVYTVRIFDANTKETEEKIGTLIFSDSPFVINNVRDGDELYLPFVRQTAKLQILSKYTELLNVDSNTRYKVSVWKGKYMVPIWFGFVISEARNQKYDSQLSEITYNLVDELSTMANVKIERGTKHDLCFVDYLQKFLCKIGADESDRFLCVGESVQELKTERETFNALLAQISNTAFTTGNTLNQEEDEFESYATLVKEFMTLLGLTMWSDGVNWYVGTYRDEEFQRVPFSFLDSSHFETELEKSQTYYIGLNNGRKVQMVDDQSYFLSQKADEITFISGTSSADKDILSDVSSKNLLPGKFVETTSHERGPENEFPWVYVQYRSNEKTGIKLYRREFMPSVGVVFGDEVDEGTEEVGVPGAYLLREDYYDTKNEEDPGTGSGKDKYNYQLNDRLYIRQTKYKNNLGIYAHGVVSSVDLYNQVYQDERYAKLVANKMIPEVCTVPLVRIYNKKAFLFNGGGICISFQMASTQQHPELAPLKATGSILGNLVCSLRIGSGYWDGTGWKSTKQLFSVQVQDKDEQTNKGMIDVTNTKTLSMPFSCKGYAIPLPDNFFGDVEFCIYGCVRTGAQVNDKLSQSPQWEAIVDFADYLLYIENLKVEYCPKYEEMQGVIDNQKELKKKVGGEGQKIEFKTRLHTDVQIERSAGAITRDGEIVKSCINQSYEGSVEQLTFDRLVDLYSKTNEYIELHMISSSVPERFGQMKIDDTFYHLLCVKQWDVREGEVQSIYKMYR